MLKGQHIVMVLGRIGVAVLIDSNAVDPHPRCVYRQQCRQKVWD